MEYAIKITMIVIIKFRGNKSIWYLGEIVSANFTNIVIFQKDCRYVSYNKIFELITEHTYVLLKILYFTTFLLNSQFLSKRIVPKPPYKSILLGSITNQKGTDCCTELSKAAPNANEQTNTN